MFLRTLRKRICTQRRVLWRRVHSRPGGFVLGQKNKHNPTTLLTGNGLHRHLVEGVPSLSWSFIQVVKNASELIHESAELHGTKTLRYLLTCHDSMKLLCETLVLCLGKRLACGVRPLPLPLSSLATAKHHLRTRTEPNYHLPRYISS